MKLLLIEFELKDDTDTDDFETELASAMDNRLEGEMDKCTGWTKTSFIENVFEIAFGDDAINKDYSREEVLIKLREFSDGSV